jgi:hypothetical protein
MKGGISGQLVDHLGFDKGWASRSSGLSLYICEA